MTDQKLPLYECHKRVRAAKILAIEPVNRLEPEQISPDLEPLFILRLAGLSGLLEAWSRIVGERWLLKHKLVSLTQGCAGSPMQQDFLTQASHYLATAQDIEQQLWKAYNDLCAIDKLSPTTFKAWGYFVEYEDGYTSWSPSKPFEEGYQLLREKP